jgi:hypothetical protein
MPTSPTARCTAFHPPTAPSCTEEFAPAFEEAAAGKRAAVIELAMDPEMITTRTTLSAIRHQVEAQQAAKAEA